MSFAMPFKQESPGVAYYEVGQTRYYLIEKDGSTRIAEIKNGTTMRELEVEDSMEAQVRIEFWIRDNEPDEVRRAREKLRETTS